MMRVVHGEELRERQRIRMAAGASADELVHRCRSCYETFDEPKVQCPACGFVDRNSSHGATNAEVA